MSDAYQAIQKSFLKGNCCVLLDIVTLENVKGSFLDKYDCLVVNIITNLVMLR